MGHMAKIENGVVTFVTVSRDEDDDSELEISQQTGDTYRRTSYNTRGGQHANGGTPFRYNYAGIGYTFDPDFGPDGAFIPPKPEEGEWVLDPDTALWVEVTPES